MIAPCSLSGYLWRRYWVRFRALGRDEPDQPSAFDYLPINNCGECHHGLFALRRHCPVLSADFWAPFPACSAPRRSSVPRKGLRPRTSFRPGLAADARDARFRGQAAHEEMSVNGAPVSIANPSKRWGRKASGLRVHAWDSGLAGVVLTPGVIPPWSRKARQGGRPSRMMAAIGTGAREARRER